MIPYRLHNIILLAIVLLCNIGTAQMVPDSLIENDATEYVRKNNNWYSGERLVFERSFFLLETMKEDTLKKFEVVDTFEITFVKKGICLTEFKYQAYSNSYNFSRQVDCPQDLIPRQKPPMIEGVMDTSGDEVKWTIDNCDIVSNYWTNVYNMIQECKLKIGTNQYQLNSIRNNANDCKNYNRFLLFDFSRLFDIENIIIPLVDTVSYTKHSKILKNFPKTCFNILIPSKRNGIRFIEGNEKSYKMRDLFAHLGWDEERLKSFDEVNGDISSGDLDNSRYEIELDENYEFDELECYKSRQKQFSEPKSLVEETIRLRLLTSYK